MGTRRRAAKLIFVLILVLGSATAVLAGPVRFTLPQVAAYLPHITVFASLSDQHGSPLQQFAPSDFSLKVDGHTLAIDAVASFGQSQMGVAYTLALDVSKTMSGAPFERAMAGARKFIQGLGPKDRLAILTFGDEVSVLSDFSADKEALTAKLAGITPKGQKTQFYSAIKAALDLNQRYDGDLPIRRAIIAVSDGKDEGSGITLEDLLRQNRRMGVPIYSLGYSRIEPQFLDVLKRLSDLNDGRFLADQPSEIPDGLFEKIIQHIGSQLVITAEDRQNRADGSAHVVQVVYDKDPVKVAAEKRVYFNREASPREGAEAAANDDREAVDADQAKSALAKFRESSAGVLLALHLPTGDYWVWGLWGAVILLLLILAALIIWLVVRKRRGARAAGAEPGFGDEREAAGGKAPGYYEEDTVDPGDLSTTQEIRQRMPGAAGMRRSAHRTDGNLPETTIELIALTGPLEGTRFQKSVDAKGLGIGRKAALAIADDEVSRLHCTITWDGRRLRIRDEDSQNGTMLNGVAVRIPEVLDDGSILEMGKSKFRVKVIAQP